MKLENASDACKLWAATIAILLLMILAAAGTHRSSTRAMDSDTLFGGRTTLGIIETTTCATQWRNL